LNICITLRNNSVIRWNLYKDKLRNGLRVPVPPAAAHRPPSNYTNITQVLAAVNANGGLSNYSNVASNDALANVFTNVKTVRRWHWRLLLLLVLELAGRTGRTKRMGVATFGTKSP